jgi:hypothetical protein
VPGGGNNLDYLFSDPKRMVVFTPGFHGMTFWPFLIVYQSCLTTVALVVEGGGLDDDELKEMYVLT